ncbi:hypothetical protein HY407_01575 [Candidatus Gottesmanbacteria bacterium]|nr:hypothetical protein [Candidatus Gottesmanbacteria bacterium]
MAKVFNLTSLSQKFGECYVARLKDTDKVIAHAKDADQLLAKIKGREEFKKNKLVISWIPKYGARYVFRISLPICQS